MKLDGYIRVSNVGDRKGESFISPSAQREEIGRWIAANGASIGEVYEELDESGLRGDRPLLMEAIERVESGASDGIVVARLNRLARSVLHGISLIAQIQRAGGTLVSVQQGFDLSTSTGQLVANILFSVGQWEADEHRVYWDMARRKAIDRGVYPCRKGPVGYRRGADGRLAVDSVEGPVVREMFKRRMAGANVPALVDFLNQSVVATESGQPFTTGRVYAMIRNSAYCGTAHSGRHSNPDAHEPIIDRASWQQCQCLPRPPGEWVEALTSGRIRCANCGAMMTAVRSSNHPSRSNVYRCESTRAECDAPAQAPMEEIDPLVEEFVFRHSQVGRRVGGDRKTERHAAAVARAQEDLNEYRDNIPLQRTLGPEGFEAGVAKRASVLERKLLELARVKQPIGEPRVDLGALERDWPKLSWKQRRRAVGQLIDLVVVERGRRPVIERAWIFKKGTGPVAQGRRRRIDFTPPLDDKARLKEHKPWGEQQVEAELRAFFAGRPKEWPPYLGFAKSGHARLHAQAMAWGGPYYWGHRLAITVPHWTVRWNHRYLEGALRPFLRGRRKWPGKKTFEKAGLVPIYEAVRNNGGFAFWADKFGLRYEPRNGSKRHIWSGERVDRELSALLKGRDVFPCKSEFEEMGAIKLYGAVIRHGGIDHWAERFGLPTWTDALDRRKHLLAESRRIAD